MSLAPPHADAPPRGPGTAPDPSSPCRVLTYSTLYPNAEQPSHGIFVETRLRHVAATGRAKLDVVAPVPWFPLPAGPYGSFARVPRVEERNGLGITHPRYPVIPKVGMTVAPALLAAATYPHVRRRVAATTPHLIDAHYLYPDGVAAAWIARRLGLPLVMTARGTDVNLIPDYPLPRRMILWACQQAHAVICVCEALRTRLLELGVEAAKLHVLRNGVDLERFTPMDQRLARLETGMRGRSLLSVGHLIERKGHHLTIEALARLPDDVRLTIVGSGPLESALRAQCESLGVANRVQFAGPQPQSALPRFYAAADALVLASSREGMANVLLESLACGTPVIATPAWGTPEVVSSADAGVLASGRSAGAIADAVQRLLSDPPESERVRAHAELFHWAPTTQGQLDIFQRLAGAHHSAAQLQATA
jgi:teichuronic acid biosynthesis glycosyltransferase TuaC